MWSPITGAIARLGAPVGLISAPFIFMDHQINALTMTQSCAVDAARPPPEIALGSVNLQHPPPRGCFPFRYVKRAPLIC